MSMSQVLRVPKEEGVKGGLCEDATLGPAKGAVGAVVAEYSEDIVFLRCVASHCKVKKERQRNPLVVRTSTTFICSPRWRHNELEAEGERQGNII